MDDRNYRKYSQEFKLEALELLQRGDKSDAYSVIIIKIIWQ